MAYKKEVSLYYQTLKQIKKLFEEGEDRPKVIKAKSGKTYNYNIKYKYNKIKRRNLTEEEINYIQTHTAIEIQKHFNKSTSWVYARIAGDYTTRI